MSLFSRTGPVVRFLREKLAEAGCSVEPHPERAPFFHVRHCDQSVAGGFVPTEGVVVCHNHLTSREEVEHALAHELIHAYDHCRAKNLDWTDCKHHACSEVRAAALSGDCSWKQELLRGRMGLSAQFRSCVRRRAVLSCELNPNCGSTVGARRAVDAVFEKCIADTDPFDRLP